MRNRRLGLGMLAVLVVVIALSTSICAKGQTSPHIAPNRMATDSAAWLYTEVNIILASEGMDLGSSAANSLDRSVHYNWAKVQNIQTIEDETVRKIMIVAGNTDKFLDMYTQVSLELAHTGVFTGGAASLDSSVHYNWARDNVNYAKSTAGVRDSLIGKIYTAYESV